MYKKTVSIITMVLLAMSSASAKESTLSTKDIVVVATAQQNMRPVSSTRSYRDTIIYARGAKKEYAVGEPIKVQLKLRRNAYIYFWTVGADGRGYLILPNNLDSFNKYQRNTQYAVPNRKALYHFISDRVGVEKVFVLATNKKIDKGTIQSIFDKKAGGVIPMASYKSIKSFVEKDIRVVAKKQKFKYDIRAFEIGVYPNKNANRTTNSNVNINIYQ